MISELFLIFAGITALFALFVIVQSLSNWRFCALCASVSITWVVLLVLYWLDIFTSPILLAVLVGTSITGIYYLLEKKIRESLQIFRLPFFLTLVFVAYLVLGAERIESESGLFLIILWALFLGIFIFRTNPRLKKIAERLIACCKNW